MVATYWVLKITRVWPGSDYKQTGVAEDISISELRVLVRAGRFLQVTRMLHIH
jgi:hypothetical protein